MSDLTAEGMALEAAYDEDSPMIHPCAAGHRHRSPEAAESCGDARKIVALRARVADLEQERDAIRADLARVTAERDEAKEAEAAAIRTMDQAIDEYAKLPRVESDLAAARQEAEALRGRIEALPTCSPGRLDDVIGMVDEPDREVGWLFRGDVLDLLSAPAAPAHTDHCIARQEVAALRAQVEARDALLKELETLVSAVLTSVLFGFTPPPGYDRGMAEALKLKIDAALDAKGGT